MSSRQLIALLLDDLAAESAWLDGLVAPLPETAWSWSHPGARLVDRPSGRAPDLDR